MSRTLGRARGADTRALREWTLRLLGDEAGPPDSLWADVADRAPRHWAVFLSVEGCALAIQNRLNALGAWSRLSARSAAAIRRCATEELFSVLSARAQVKTIARLATEHGWTVVLLKGGAAVAEGELLDLNDVDILVAPERAADVAAALDALGFEPQGADLDDRHHLSGRVEPDALRIEVHRRVKNGGGLADFLPAAVPIRAAPPLLAMGPADNVRYLLRHATEQHPERIGRLRDLLLIAHALRACSPERIETIGRELAEGEDETAAAMLSVALRLAGGAPEWTEPDDPFERLALRRCIVFHRFGRGFDHESGAAILARTLRILGQGRSGWWRAFRALFPIPADATPPVRAVAWVHRRSRLLGNAAWRVARLVSFGTASTIALLADLEGRWIEARGPGRGSGHGPDHEPTAGDGPRVKAASEGVREIAGRTGPEERGS